MLHFLKSSGHQDFICTELVTAWSIMHLDLLCEISDELKTKVKTDRNFKVSFFVFLHVVWMLQQSSSCFCTDFLRRLSSLMEQPILSLMSTNFLHPKKTAGTIFTPFFFILSVVVCNKAFIFLQRKQRLILTDEFWVFFFTPCVFREQMDWCDVLSFG